MPVDHEVDVISVRKRVMSAADAMFVVDCVSTARMRRRTGVRVRSAYLDRVLVDVAFVGVMKVTVVCVVLVPSMADHGVAATRGVSVRMNLVRLVRAHGHRRTSKYRAGRRVPRTPERASRRQRDTQSASSAFLQCTRYDATESLAHPRNGEKVRPATSRPAVALGYRLELGHGPCSARTDRAGPKPASERFAF